MTEKKTDSKPAAKSTDAGEASVQAQFDEAHKDGFFGSSSDPTPTENYTLKGVTAGKPTPETDNAAAVEALKVRVAGAEGVTQ